MEARDIIRVPDPRQNVRVELREVVRDIGEKPHVLIRLKLTGWHFEERSEEPFVLVGQTVSRFVRIEPDGSASAYFDRPVSRAERVSFGYGQTIEFDFDVKLDPEQMPRLERAKLPRGAADPFQEIR